MSGLAIGVVEIVVDYIVGSIIAAMVIPMLVGALCYLIPRAIYLEIAEVIA